MIYPNNDIKIYGLIRVRNEEHIIIETLNHMQQFCTGGIFVYDDCSTDATASICESHKSVLKIVRGQEWDSDRAKAEYRKSSPDFERSKEICYKR